MENSGSSTSSSGSGSSGNYGTLGRGGGGGMASMMDEMAKTLARRRAAAEKKQPEQPPVCDIDRDLNTSCFDKHVEKLTREKGKEKNRVILFAGAGELARQKVLG